MCLTLQSTSGTGSANASEDLNSGTDGQVRRLDFFAILAVRFYQAHASPPRQKSVGGLSAASPTYSAEPTDEPVAVRSTRRCAEVGAAISAVDLNRRLAAIYKQNGSGHKRCLIRGQKQNAIGHFAWRSRPLQHGVAPEFLHKFIQLPAGISCSILMK